MSRREQVGYLLVLVRGVGVPFQQRLDDLPVALLGREHDRGHVVVVVVVQIDPPLDQFLKETRRWKRG